MRFTRLAILIFAMMTLVYCPAFAGSAQGSLPRNFSFEDAAGFARQVENYAARQGAHVFILARPGMPKGQLPKGIQFTHVGLAVYSQIQTETGEMLKGYAVYNLYQDPDDLSVSRLVTDYPVDFYSAAAELRTGIIIPTPKLQQKLLDEISRNTHVRLHNPSYSMIANPYSSTFQNCTEHLLDLLFAALYATESPAQIKANQLAYFKAHRLEVSAFTRLLAPLFTSDIRMQDQGTSIQLATFTTIANFMTQYGLADHITVLDQATLLPKG